MKKFVYCVGVYESWMTSSDSDEYAEEKTPYFETGPYYLASEVDPIRSRLAEAETALLNAMMGNANAVAAYLSKYPDPYSVS